MDNFDEEDLESYGFRLAKVINDANKDGLSVSENRASYQPIRRFEDIVAWQKARVLVREVYKTTSEARFVKDLRLSGQIQSAAVSAMSNISEGHERTGLATYHHLLSVARGSCGEVRSLLYVALDIGYIQEDRFNELYYMCSEVGRLISGLMAAIDRARKN